MPTDTVARHSTSALGRALLVLGWVAVLLPALYMTLVGWNSGEHGGTVILAGLFATVFQLALWGSVWKATRRQADVTRCLAFGAGAATSLILSLIVLALTVSPAWAGTTSVVSALLTVALVAWLADLGPTRQSEDHS